MQRFKKIFFATDFSECAEHAQEYAFALANRFKSQLHVGHVVDTAYPSYAGVYGFGAQVDLHIDEVKQHAQEELVKICDAAREQGVEAHPHLLGGRPAEEIVQKAQDGECDLIVIGTHGRSGFDHFLFGSTCERVVRFSAFPVLSVKAPEKEFVDEIGAIDIRRVLCPCDFSEVTPEAVAIAADISGIFGAELVLLHVVDSRIEYPMLMPGANLPTGAELHEHALAKLNDYAAAYPKLDVKVEVVTGTPHKEIVESARQGDVDLVVMSTHGRTGLPLALIGSTAEKIVRTVPVPILTARPAERAKTKEEAGEAAPGRAEPAPA